MANGKYSIRIKIKKKTRVLAQVLFLGDLPASSCAADYPVCRRAARRRSLSFFAVKIGTARRKK